MWVCFFSEKHGLQNGIIKGGKKKKTKPFVLGLYQLTFYRWSSSGLQNITSVERSENLQEIYGSPVKILVAFFVAESIKSFLNNEVVGQIKRPVISGDFRSNVSQGSLPKKMKLTELEKSECVKAAKSVKGMWLGVDFIPSKDREKEPPYFIEINSSPGTGHIDELNDINISEMVLNTFKNRDNWR